jgi:hypothetical protein
MREEEGPQDIDPRKALELLERLARDDEFRSRVEFDPRGSFAEYGLELPDRVAEREVHLPPPEAIEEALAALPQDESFRLNPEPGPLLIAAFYFIFFWLRADE